MRKLKKYKFAEDKVKNLKFLSGMGIDLKTKKELQKEAKKWIKYIKLHSKDIKHPFNNMYHQGEIAFIELFFFSEAKNKKIKIGEKMKNKCLNKKCPAWRPCGCFQNLEEICKKFKEKK